MAYENGGSVKVQGAEADLREALQAIQTHRDGVRHNVPDMDPDTTLEVIEGHLMTALVKMRAGLV